ncbi:hypothetical protein F5B22DRAFT_50983 [Xylaria bambusicola]|uniref:uncharacterized protein n=1 Tax=Xylaria bambusicola TaxID=326684 RepID=UPI002008A6AE|nr:uncharacterized protein F5B22DRAFT_50983 [Xylaria bambusicola]KAI0520774.1 hypothetical protein F5B22DRAFT_50983 [Xylaria bambusicola]
MRLSSAGHNQLRLVGSCLGIRVVGLLGTHLAANTVGIGWHGALPALAQPEPIERLAFSHPPSIDSLVFDRKLRPTSWDREPALPSRSLFIILTLNLPFCLIVTFVIVSLLMCPCLHSLASCLPFT